MATSTRPDISYAVSVLSQFNTCYDQSHWIAGKRILRYLKGTKDHGLQFRKNHEPLTGYVDADYAGCIVDRRSYTGYAFKFAGATISWEARKQRTVATSSTQAEYMALSEGAKEAMYLKNFLSDLGIDVKKVTLYNDNQGAQKLVRNPIFHNRTKHIEVRHHFIREVYEAGTIDIKYKPTEEMIADVLTKGLHSPKHQKFVKMLGVGEINHS